LLEYGSTCQRTQEPSPPFHQPHVGIPEADMA
jgi:hypothetical protein